MMSRDWVCSWLLILVIPSMAFAQTRAKAGQNQTSAAATAAETPVQSALEPSDSTSADPLAHGAVGAGDPAAGSPAPSAPHADAVTAAPTTAPAVASAPQPTLDEPPRSDTLRDSHASANAESVKQDDAPPTLLSNKAPKLGGYGGVSVFGSRVKRQDVVFVGGEAALLLDHRLAIGLAGYGLASRVDGPTTAYGERQRLAFGYGGFLLRYSFLFRQPYYLTIGTLVGAGGVAYTPEWNGNWSEDRDVHGEALFVVEPSVGGHLNLTRWMRFGAQVSYRFVSGAGTGNSEDRPRDKDLAGFAYGGHVQFGWL